MRPSCSSKRSARMKYESRVNKVVQGIKQGALYLLLEPQQRVNGTIALDQYVRRCSAVRGWVKEDGGS
jgi:hypothetical protein